jgi:hypothetical protein
MNMLVTFSTDITSTQRQAVQIEYEFSQNGRRTARATRMAVLAWMEGIGKTSKQVAAGFSSAWLWRAPVLLLWLTTLIHST